MDLQLPSISCQAALKVILLTRRAALTAFNAVLLPRNLCCFENESVSSSSVTFNSHLFFTKKWAAKGNRTLIGGTTTRSFAIKL